jgi:hypothetical protein
VGNREAISSAKNRTSLSSMAAVSRRNWRTRVGHFEDSFVYASGPRTVRLRRNCCLAR